ncbi:alpha/beta fold hydrolase [Roseibium sp.]|uniref:alpha/beta fold hydrolase n=1 Tax=Roseibium sp. TaxID=1936156 RepID=UPI003BAA7F27
MDKNTASVSARFRQYGEPPSQVAVVHGGPGGAGEVQPLARELGAQGYRVLEPFQTENTIAGQVAELAAQINQSCQRPVCLVGWSWGAWLVCLLAAEHPELVSRLLLVGSAPFDARHAEAVAQTRLSRLSEERQAEFARVSANLDDPGNVRRLAELTDAADTYLARGASPAEINFDREIHAAVRAEAKALRSSGRLLERLTHVRCPVTAFHGDHDPHPAIGVKEPLASVLPRSDFILLHRCGHKPWNETHAHYVFFAALESAMR